MQEKRRTFEDHLVKKIKESGYPLEMEISSLLDKEYVVFNTQYYFDEEIKQGRDIDIYAIPYVNLELFTNEELEKKIAPFELRTEIAVECKKSETHAWVFYTRPMIPPSHIHISGQYRDDYSDTDVLSSSKYDLFEELPLHYDPFKRAAVAYDKIYVQGKGNSRKEIFGAVNQLVKFVFYEKGRPPTKPSQPEKAFGILILFPIIVFDGYMFEVVLESGEPKLKKRNHLTLITHHRSPYTQEAEDFLIDVVHRSYFPEFMKKLNADFLNIRNEIIQKSEKLYENVMKSWKMYESGMDKKILFG